MRVVVVDDEPLACRGVIVRLREFTDIEIVAECGDGLSAAERIAELEPDIVFLDVQTPGMDGFDVVRALPKENLPGIIFVTAYEQHAVRAFEAHALDYLLKPLDDARFDLAVDRARELVNSTSKRAMIERVMKLLDSDSEYLSRFSVRNGTRIQNCAGCGRRVDRRCERLCGVTYSRRLSPGKRDHAFA